MHRLFHHHAVAGLDEQRHDKVERLIRLREDLNFARGRLHALRAEKGHELLPQEFIAFIGAEKILARAAAREQCRNVARDTLGRVHLARGDAAAEGIVALIRKALEQVVKRLFHVEVLFRHLADPVDAAGLCALAAPFVLRVLFVVCRGHDVAHALARLDPRVALELAVGLDHGVAVHIQDLRERALARQRAPAGQRAADDLRLDLVGDLQIDRHLRKLVDADFHVLLFSLSPAGRALTRSRRNLRWSRRGLSVRILPHNRVRCTVIFVHMT